MPTQIAPAPVGAAMACSDVTLDLDFALVAAHCAAFGSSRHDAPEVMREQLDELARSTTAFESFAELVTAKGGYRPTLRAGGPTADLARAYDAYQSHVGDPRRAEVRS